MPDIKKTRPEQTVSHQTSTMSFYWGLKSKNEQYFQIASIFKLAGRDNNQLAEEWMHSILNDIRGNPKNTRQENTGSYFSNGI